MKIVSACLVGVNCNYANKSWYSDEVKDEYKSGNLFPVCAEIMGGLHTPRIPSEIQGGDGNDVLDGKAIVITEKGNDVTKEYIKGAYAVLRIAEALNIDEAILVERSPSCGCGKIFDGSFTFRYKDGDGVTCALLKRNGIRIRRVEVNAKDEDEQMNQLRINERMKSKE